MEALPFRGGIRGRRRRRSDLETAEEERKIKELKASPRSTLHTLHFIGDIRRTFISQSLVWFGLLLGAQLTSGQVPLQSDVTKRTPSKLCFCLLLTFALHHNKMRQM